MQNGKVILAKLGKTVGLKGEVKIYFETDFLDQFKKGASFDSDIGQLTIFSYNPNKSTIIFQNYQTIELASKLVNKLLYTTVEKTLEEIKLGEDEFFWFDIIDSDIIDSGKDMGKVLEIQRIGNTDYLYVDGEKKYLIPYIDRYVKNVDIKNKTIECCDIQDLIDAS